MKISKDQINSIQHLLDRKEYGLLVSHVEEHHPEYAQAIGEDGMSALIRNIVAFGANFHIHSRQARKRLLTIQAIHRFLDVSTLSQAAIETLSFPERREKLKVDYFHKQLIHEANSK